MLRPCDLNPFSKLLSRFLLSDSWFFLLASPNQKRSPRNATELLFPRGYY